MEDPIAGAIGSTYVPTQSGSYTVSLVDSNGCEGVSDAIVINLVGMEELVAGVAGWELFPNPTQETTFLKPQGSLRGPVTVRVIDLYGRQLASHDLNPARPELELNVLGYAAGTYFLRLSDRQGNRANLKLVVQ